jgi:hypothetical protein
LSVVDAKPDPTHCQALQTWIDTGPLNDDLDLTEERDQFLKEFEAWKKAGRGAAGAAGAKGRCVCV